jgi:hypothetical protein
LVRPFLRAVDDLVDVVHDLLGIQTVFNGKVHRQEVQDATTVKKRIDALSIASMAALVLFNAECYEFQDFG